MAWFGAYRRSWASRVVRVALGVSLIAYGSTQHSLLGLVLMMLGMVPAVTGLAGISLVDEVLRGRRAARQPARGRRRGGVARLP